MSEIASENQANAVPVSPWGRRLGAAAALAALVLAGAEFTVRLEDRVRWGTPVLSTSVSVEGLMVSDSTGSHPGPERVFHKWRINSLGTRGPEPDPALANRRVLVLGASETFGLYESPGQEYVRQLADTLTATNCSADALNAGFIGMSLPTVEQDFRLRLAPLRARVTVYYPTPPQYLDDAVPHPVAIRSGETTARPAGLALRFPGRARDAFKAMLPRILQDRIRRRQIAGSQSQYPPDSLFASIPPIRLAAFDHDLRRLLSTLRSEATIPILVTHANAFVGSPPAADDRLRAWEKFYPRATGATLVAFDSAAAEVVRRIAADSGAVLVDAWREFHRAPAEKMFADFSHFTDAGAARMASLLRPAIAHALGCGA